MVGEQLASAPNQALQPTAGPDSFLGLRSYNVPGHRGAGAFGGGASIAVTEMDKLSLCPLVEGGARQFSADDKSDDRDPDGEATPN